jgi:hypothetical protein
MPGFIAQQGGASSKPINVLEMASPLHATGYSILDITTEKDPRYFESPLKCLEYVEARTSGTFLSNVPKNLKRSAHEEIQTELKKTCHSQGNRECVQYHLCRG